MAARNIANVGRELLSVESEQTVHAKRREHPIAKMWQYHYREKLARLSIQGGMKILIVIQARTASSRLPNKVLLPLAGAPLLQRMIERVQAAEGSYEIVVATTTDPHG